MRFWSFLESLFQYFDLFGYSYVLDTNILARDFSFSNKKKSRCKSSQNFTFCFWKKCGFVHRKILDKKMKKNEVQKKMPFLRQKVMGSPRRPILLWILFWYNYWCPESLEYIRPLRSHYGRPLFQKGPKLCQKIASGAYYPRQNVAPWGCNKKNIFRKQILYAWTLFVCNG